MNTAMTTQLLESGYKVITSLTDAKGTLNSAERWANENVKSISSFLTIINGSLNDTKHEIALATIHNAEDELGKFRAMLSELSIPEKYTEELKNASFPEEIKTKNFFETTLSHAEYEELKSRLDKVISYVTDIINYIS